MLRGVTLGLVVVSIFVVSVQKAPTADPTDGATHVGEKACKKCHFGQHRTWKKMKHAQTWTGLEKYLAAEHRGTNRKDAEGRQCTSCDVTGYGQAARGGFKSVADSPHLLSVQCEACQGPGSKHIEAGTKVRAEKRKSFNKDEKTYTILRTANCANGYNPQRPARRLTTSRTSRSL